MLKFFIPCNPVILFSGTHFREILACVHYQTPTATLVEALFIIGKSWGKPKCSLTRNQVKKLWYILLVEIYQGKDGQTISKCNNRVESQKYIAGEIVSCIDDIKQDTILFNLKKSKNRTKYCLGIQTYVIKTLKTYSNRTISLIVRLGGSLVGQDYKVGC